MTLRLYLAAALLIALSVTILIQLTQVSLEAIQNPIFNLGIYVLVVIASLASSVLLILKKRLGYYLALAVGLLQLLYFTGFRFVSLGPQEWWTRGLEHLGILVYDLIPIALIIILAIDFNNRKKLDLLKDN